MLGPVTTFPLGRKVGRRVGKFLLQKIQLGVSYSLQKNPERVLFFYCS